MKRVLYVVLAVCLCSFLGALIRTNSRAPQIAGVAAIQEIDTQNILAVSMDKNTIRNPLIGKGTAQFYRFYRFHNKTEKPIEVSWHAWLEIFIDGVWYQLATPEATAHMDIEPIWRIYPGGVHEYPGDYLSSYRSQLRPGKYRRVWPAFFASDEAPFYVAVEFIVK